MLDYNTDLCSLTSRRVPRVSNTEGLLLRESFLPGLIIGLGNFV